MPSRFTLQTVWIGSAGLKVFNLCPFITPCCDITQKFLLLLCVCHIEFDDFDDDRIAEHVYSRDQGRTVSLYVQMWVFLQLILASWWIRHLYSHLAAPHNKSHFKTHLMKCRKINYVNSTYLWMLLGGKKIHN